jgi:transposase
MDLKYIISQFLGIQDVIIEDIKLFKKDLRAVVVARQNRKHCYCNKCGLQLSQVHEWIFKELKGVPLGIFSDVTLKFYQLRANCDDCDKVILAPNHLIHPKFSSMTCAFAEHAGRLMEEITCEAVSRILHCNSKTLWDLDQYRMEYMMKFLKLPKDIDVSYLSADEVHFKTIRIQERKGLFAKRWQPKFITNLVCPTEGKVLFNGPGRDGNALATALSVLSPGQLLAVERFAIDMHDPFFVTIKKLCPNAEICVDRFHLAQAVNKAFDKVRRSEFKLAKEKKNQFCEDMLEPHRRFILVSREKDLSKAELKLLSKLRDVNQSIHTAMLLVEYFHAMLDKKTVKSFRKAMITWCLVVRESKLKPFLELAKTIRKYRKNIEAYITSRLTTGVAEGINNKIKVLKRMGYGYTNETSFMRKILQRCGYLNHLSINTDQFFYRLPHP